MPGIAVDGDNIGKPRYQILSVGRTLKVISRPDEPEARGEFGVHATQIFVSAMPKRPPIFTWKTEREAFMLHTEDKVLSIARISKFRQDTSATVEVLKCR
jgi:hypothetical protein